MSNRLPERLAGVSLPLVGVAVAVVAVSTSAILVRFTGAPSAVAAFYRVLFTTLLLAPLGLWRYRDALAHLSGREVLAAAATGVALAVHFATWFESLAWTSVAASVTLVQAQPVFVAIGGALLLGERVRRRAAVGIAVAIAGMAAMTLGEAGQVVAGARPLYGNALALVGAVTAAAYFLAGRGLRQRIPVVPYVLVVYAACAAVLLAVVLVSDAPLVDYPAGDWLVFLGMAVGPGILGHTLINWALEHVEAHVVSVSLVAEPLGSSLLAVALLGEVPAVVTVGGGVVVLAGIVLTATAGPES